MEPGKQYAQQDAPDAPTTWSTPPTAPAGGYPPPNAAATGYTPPTAPRARIGLIVLTALIIEILLIGGGANQWVTNRILRHTDGTLRTRLIQNSWLTFNWRFSPPTGLTSHWAAQMLLVACVLLFTAAFVWCLLRGPVTWGRAFIGSWLAVLGATVLGGIVRGLIDPFGKFSLPGTDRVTRALFGGSGPTSVVVVGGIALGFVVAVITSIVAVVSRRPAVAGYGRPAEPGPPTFANPAFPDYVPPAASASGPMRPWQDQPYRPPTGGPSDSPTGGSSDQPTTQLPVDQPTGGPSADQPTGGRTDQPTGGPSDQPTTQLPAVPPRAAGNDSVDQPTTQLPAMPPPPPRAASAPANEPATTRFPRPPDDEDLGHFEG